MKNKLRTANGQFTGDFTQLALYTRELEARLRTMEAKLKAADKIVDFFSVEHFMGTQEAVDRLVLKQEELFETYRNAGGE